MNIRYIIVALGLCAGLAQAATQGFEVVGSDLDDVATQTTSSSTYFYASAKALGLKTFSKGLWHLMTSSQFRTDIWAAMTKKLRYRDGRKVIGAAAYVEFLAQHDMPFISDEQKAKLIEIAWQVKPNVELLEFYQFLQKNNILVYVWTDNDRTGYDKKIAILNAELIKLGRQPFIPDGVQCAIGNTPTDPGLSKDHAGYFKEAYQTIQSQHPELGATPKVLFIDDKMKNIKNARNAAEKETLNIEALQYKGTKSELDQIRTLFVVHQ